MKFLTPYKYYMRMDDDSLMTGKPDVDPFKMMEGEGLNYVWKRNVGDTSGVAPLMQVVQPYIAKKDCPTEFFRRDRPEKPKLKNVSPYNNFHIARVDFFRSPDWIKLMAEVDKQHIYYRHKLGDSSTHAVALCYMPTGTFRKWGNFPYGHNSNDFGANFGHGVLQECKQAYEAAGIPVPSYNISEEYWVKGVQGI